MIQGLSEYKFSQETSTPIGGMMNFDFALMKKWHFVQLAIGYKN